MRLYREPGELGDRIGDDRVDRLRLVDEAIDKGRIGPVLQQPPHQVREQILVAADRCIDAAWSIKPLRSDDLFIERLTHPVQTLELVIPALAGELEEGRHRMRVVSGKLRIENRPECQQPACTGEIGDVGCDLAGVDRVPVEPELLGAFDLAVPVGALNKTDHQPPPASPSQIGEPLDDRKSTFLIGLDGEAEPIPIGKIGRERERLEEIEREIEAVGFLGIDRQTDTGPPRVAGELEENQGHFGQHPRALRHLVARVQRRQFDRNAWSVGNNPTPPRTADRGDRVVVGSRVARGIRRGVRCLAEHVVGMTVALLFGSPRTLERLPDRAPHDELTANDMHRRSHSLAQHWFAGASNKAAQNGAQIGCRRYGVQEAPSQHQRPGRSVDEHRFRTPEMTFPVR